MKTKSHNQSLKNSKRPLVIGHRGACGTEPENTMRSFAKALKMGAHGIELDIFLTRDKEIVVTHDRNTLRLTGKKRDVTKLNYKELLELDFGKGEKIPLLSQVFDEFLGKFEIINVEIKSTGLFTNGIELALATLIENYDCAHKIIVSSFNPLNLWRFKRLMPEVRIGYLLCREQILLARNRIAANLIGPDTLNLDKAFIKFKKFGRFFDMPQPKWIWTINTPEEMRFWLTHDNVAAIITNFPDKLISMMDQ